MTIQQITKRNRGMRPRNREIEYLIESIRFNVMGIIFSCESPDIAGLYDIGHRDGVDEVKVTVESYFRHLPEEI